MQIGLVSFIQDAEEYKVKEEKMLNMSMYFSLSIIKISIFFIASDSYFIFAIIVSILKHIRHNLQNTIYIHSIISTIHTSS